MKQNGKRIPISAAKRIAEEFGYEQVIIIARHPDPVNGIEHVTTYGKTIQHCEIAAKVGNYIKYEIMKWEKK